MPRTSEGQPRLALRASRSGVAESAPWTGEGGSGGGAAHRGLQPIVVTMGDPSGVGPEILLKALAARARAGRSEFSVVGSRPVLGACARALGLEPPRSIVAVGSEGLAWEPGRPSAAGARAALQAITEAARLCTDGEALAMVTAPVSKSGIAAQGHAFPGHTEFLADLTGASGYVMTFVSGVRRVGLVTTHLPISEVPGALSEEVIVGKLTVLARGLTQWFGIERPRIAVAALNPHAGEGGLIGGEDDAIVRPAVEAARRAGHDASGPFPADTIYCGLGEPEGAGPGAAYDAVLAMYHDQGTIPIKLWGLASGVNVTLGLPIVRTSVDHGTAYDIAGRGTADPGSLLAAIELAEEIVERRGDAGGRPGNRLDPSKTPSVES
jgi:4-hydroxythreonine-4-phosphate dehydrogenase